jgi:hypothetical protein
MNIASTQKGSFPKSRGIVNISGEACHVAAAIQVNSHSISDICRQHFIALSNAIIHEYGNDDYSYSYNYNGNDKEINIAVNPQHAESQAFLVEFGKLLDQIKMSDQNNEIPNKNDASSSIDVDNGNTNALDSSASAYAKMTSRKDGADPTYFYQTLVNVNAMNVGDAGASMRSILGTMRQALDIVGAPSSNADELDATSKRKLIHDMVHTIHNQLQTCFWSGRASHELVGSKLIKIWEEKGGRGVTMQCRRRKERKERVLSCPIPIPVKGYATIEDSLYSVISGSQSVRSYDWESLDGKDYVEERVEIDVDDASDADAKNVSEIVTELEHLDLSSKIKRDAVGSKLDGSSKSSSENIPTDSSAIDTDADGDDDESDSSTSSSSSSSCSSASSVDSFDHWRTSTITRPLSLPQVLVLQLNRSEFKQGRVQLISDAINVPYEFEFELNSHPHPSNSNCHRYHLIGAVVHTDRNDSSSLDRQEDGNGNGTGHYVTYMKEMRQNVTSCLKNDQEVWIKMDDEKVSMFLVGSGQAQQKIVSRNALCALFGGKTRSRNNFATLLVYKELE